MSERSRIMMRRLEIVWKLKYLFWHERGLDAACRRRRQALREKCKSFLIQAKAGIGVPGYTTHLLRIISVILQLHVLLFFLPYFRVAIIKLLNPNVDWVNVVSGFCSVHPIQQITVQTSTAAANRNRMHHSSYSISSFKIWSWYWFSILIDGGKQLWISLIPLAHKSLVTAFMPRWVGCLLARNSAEGILNLHLKVESEPTGRVRGTGSERAGMKLSLFRTKAVRKRSNASYPRDKPKGINKTYLIKTVDERGWESQHPIPQFFVNFPISINESWSFAQIMPDCMTLPGYWSRRYHLITSLIQLRHVPGNLFINIIGFALWNAKRELARFCPQQKYSSAR